jgi:hypothetical protein
MGRRNGSMEIYKGEIMEEEVRKKLEEHEKRIIELEKYLPKKDMKISTEKISFENFAKQKKPINHEQRALVIGCYIWKIEKRNFSWEDVKEYCKKATWPTHSNATMLFKGLKKKDLVEEVRKNSKGIIEYRILEDGLNFVENNFKDVINERR